MAALFDPALDARITELARTPVLLVASDYDGVIAPLVDDPGAAVPLRESIVALRSLAAMADTHVAVISGRSLRDLATLSRLPEEVQLIGSHGSEFDAGFASALSDEQVALRNRISKQLSQLAKREDGFSVEVKPASIAFHYRNAPDAAGVEAVAEIMAGPATLEGVGVKRGKDVLELTVVATDKGTALDTVRGNVAAEAVMFLGDDVTDEDAFVTLQGPDAGIKVGGGETAAGFRVPDTAAASHVLAAVCERRRAWLHGGSAPDIQEHSLLSDQRAVALLTPDARVAWMCLPAADSPSVFGELLGGHSAGVFAVAPAIGGGPIAQRYVDYTLILETRWADLTVTDYLDCSGDRPDEPAARVDFIRHLSGSGEVTIDFDPRFDYGRALSRVEINGDWLIVRGGNHTIELHAPGVSWEVHVDGDHEWARGSGILDGDPTLTMLFGAEPDQDLPTEDLRRSGSAAHWSDWAAALTLPSKKMRLVRRSALTLKALCHQPSGSILAAATTSLPEVIGGVRNWDYRHCWPRDAALTATSLVRLGSMFEAEAFLAWVLDRLAHLPSPEQLRPVYPLVGDSPIPEATLPNFHGYRGSRPVRIGNAAESQVQLDVFGPIVDLVHVMCEAGFELQDRHWDVVVAMVAAVDARWHEPDHGIWEERRPQRHHVHSKVMCWMAVDRALRIAEGCGRTVPDTWAPLRGHIAEDILQNGWNERLQTFTIAYGDDELDAAVLWVGLSGLLDASDPRFQSTIKAVERELRTGEAVYRYRLDDGLPGIEGGFLICMSWLIEAYVLAGQQADAETLFRRYVEMVGDTGLLSEEYDPVGETMLGNHPQAYSHLGLINSALALS